ncbi:MAG: hypothetical protein ACE5J5_03020 [Candidatus Hydrothermarchaeales archaeon]
MPLCLERSKTPGEKEIAIIKEVFSRCSINVEDTVFELQPSKPLIILDYSPPDKLEMNSCTMETEDEAKDKAEKLRQMGYHTFIYIPEAPGEGGSVVTEEIASCEHADRRLYLLTHEAMHHFLEGVERDWREPLMLEEAATNCFAIKLAKTVAVKLYGPDSEEAKLVNGLDKGYHDSAYYLKEAGGVFKSDKKRFLELAEKAYSFKTFSGGCGRGGASEYKPETMENTVRFAISYTQSLYPLMEELYSKKGCNGSFETLKEAMKVASANNMQKGIAYIEDSLGHKEKKYQDIINIWGHHKKGARISCKDLTKMV